MTWIFAALILAALAAPISAQAVANRDGVMLKGKKNTKADQSHTEPKTRPGDHD